MFIDLAKIEVKSGRGGKGVDSFYKDKLTRSGHPDGGDGGCGGDVIVRVSANAHTLIDFQYRRHFKADKGKDGSSKKKKGHDGADSIIKVPVGTLIYDHEKNTLLADLTKIDEEIIVAKGGQGGKGNRSHKNATLGGGEEQKIIRLELKLIADVGIIGFPNSGKSTLISKISKARPKIAPYPFTTKFPVLGVVEHNGFEFKIAEVPGLIKGAHTGRGLGDLFLRHTERTNILIHLIDIADTTRDSYDNYKDISEELRLYGKGVNKKPRIIVANKIDLDEAKINIENLKKKLKKDIFTISSKTGEGLDKLLDEVCNRLKENAKTK